MTTPAGDLVRAFADVDRMDAMYADEIVWTLPASLGPAAGPHHGREAVVAFNRAVWGQYYSPEGVEVEVVEELRDGDRSAARFVYRATVLASGERYENHYTLFARSSGGRIVEVHEGLDTLKLTHFQGLRTQLPVVPD
jgi:ketosteroid isomerase-like protein